VASLSTPPPDNEPVKGNNPPRVISVGAASNEIVAFDGVNIKIDVTKIIVNSMINLLKPLFDII
jgi:hypothetical protein